MAIEHQFPYRVVSGFRPARSLHIGHYAGVLSDLLRDQYAYRDATFVFVADHHARSKWNDGADFVSLGQNTIATARGLIALGLNPNYCVLYRQSDISEIFEPMWFFAGMVGDGWLRRGHALKSDLSATAGTYLYPLLMVSDILSLKATHVAIGGDQRQHLELAREIARKLVTRFGRNLLPIPESLRSEPVLLPGIDSTESEGRKMAVENQNEIPIFAEDDVVRQRIERIVTRTVGWGEKLPTERCNILAYAECMGGLTARVQFEQMYLSGRYGYREMKNELTELFFSTFSDARQRYADLDEHRILEILADGAARARTQIGSLLFELRKIVRGVA